MATACKLADSTDVLVNLHNEKLGVQSDLIHSATLHEGLNGVVAFTVIG